MTDGPAQHVGAVTKLAGAVGIVVCLVGLTVAIGGWAFGVQWLAAPVSGASSMKMNTALGIALVGLAVAVIALTKMRWIATAAAAVLVIIGATTVGEYAIRSKATWFDQALSRETFGKTSEYVNRMGFNTALCLLLLGVALAMISRSTWITAAQIINAVVCLVTYIAVLGYVMDVGFVVQPNVAWTQMAPHTSVLLFVSSLAIFGLNPDSGVMAQVSDDHAGGRQARFLIPTVFLGSMMMGVAVRVMDGLGLQQPIPAQIAVGLFTVALLPVIWTVALLNNRIDRQRQHNEAISIAVESAPDGVLVVDSQGVIAVANAAVAGILKLPATEIVGRNVDEFVPPRAKGHHRALREGFALKPGSRPMGLTPDIEVRSSDGSLTPVDIALSPVDLGGSAQNVFVSIRDRSELVRANRDLQQFAYVASHDLRAPLRTVSGFADLLRFSMQDHDLTEDQIDAFAEISGGIEKMNSLISALLAYSRVGRESANLESTVIATQIAETLALAAADVGSSGVQVASDVPPELTWMVDADLMRSALLNVVSNSIKYRREDVEPRIEFAAQVPRFGGKRLTIRDNGQGIGADHVDRSMEMFQRLTTKGDGLGIGLAMAKRIVEVQNGRITIDSDGHSFTAVSIWVPE